MKEILLIVCLIIVALLIGYFIGRRSIPAKVGSLIHVVHEGEDLYFLEFDKESMKQTVSTMKSVRLTVRSSQ